VGAPDASAPEMGEEARAVADTLAPARLFEGRDARWEALRLARRPRCLHVAAHGRFRADAPGASGVRLADGWARAVEFRALRLQGSLVVLSGCETGVSHVDAGGEVHGLVRGVLASGASELLVSLWRVDDAATARFMGRFHGLRVQGLTAESALARVQAERAADGLHPWYWAGFTLWTRRLVPARVSRRRVAVR
jgi:CHAT domain-containing protein